MEPGGVCSRDRGVWTVWWALRKFSRGTSIAKGRCAIRSGAGMTTDIDVCLRSQAAKISIGIHMQDNHQEPELYCIPFFLGPGLQFLLDFDFLWHPFSRSSAEDDHEAWEINRRHYRARSPFHLCAITGFSKCHSFGRRTGIEDDSGQLNPFPWCIGQGKKAA